MPRVSEANKLSTDKSTPTGIITKEDEGYYLGYVDIIFDFGIVKSKADIYDDGEGICIRTRTIDLRLLFA